MTVAPEADTEVVQGTITEIIDKGAGKYQVAVQPDGSSGYAKKLWTKDVGLVGQLVPLVGQRMGFLCGVSNWTNQQGQPVRSLWINGVGQGIQEQPQAMAAPQPLPVVPQLPATPLPVAPPVAVQPTVQQMVGMQPQPVAHVQPPTEQTSRWLAEKAVERPYIHRQTATKVAAMLVSHLPPEQRTFDNLIMLSERLMSYYEHGAQHSDGVPQYVDESGGGGPDDDIPF